VVQLKRIRVLKPILASNDALAAAQRRELDKAGVVGINIMSAPGSGKTSLIERTAEALKSQYRIQVIEGDIKGDLDTCRVAAKGVDCIQINTQGDCHLDALMLSSVLPRINLKKTDLLIVENVGNLVCPAEFKLPTHYNVMILSTPEGSDKPTKYPLMFSKSDLLIINKIDLLPYVSFDYWQMARAVKLIKPRLPIIRLSAKTGEGLPLWFAWLRRKLAGPASKS
jgi:hydrogenase nickel incorporation protein HypB